MHMKSFPEYVTISPFFSATPLTTLLPPRVTSVKIFNDLLLYFDFLPRLERFAQL